ncbi:SDR family oxidoreductase [Erythrobacter sp.]|jgi:NAD(P)-dependent dehydrogenase (short-subunit alcohol dehydrogenase family)|uniref:SDR family oxidoreductase n=1 Tax=Erythrobacter sp. TaxID=1042 RepID=UPI002EA551A3|nr:SDR family oxidoreductase [Erythrobacter sp.]
MTRPAILVTGGATRIGAAIVTGFAEAGWHAVIHYGTSADAAEELARSLPSAETVQCDLADDEAAHAMIRSLAGRLSDWRCLVNSASVFEYDDVTGCDPQTYQRAMQVNALSPARMAQAFLAHAHSDAGRVVIQITDMKLANPNPDFFSYTMSKHALAATIPMLAKGAAGPEDRVYGLAPGAILASHDQREEETEVSHRLNLLGRKTGADEIVAAARFLATRAMRSGSSLFVDSGQHLLDQDRDVIWLAREKVRAGESPA